MPDPLPSDVQLHSHLPRPCPASIFTCCHPAGEEAGKKEPYYTVAKYDNTIYVDPELADKSIALLANFDASPNVLVAIAHDPAIAAFLPCIDQPGNEQSDIGGWRAAGFKAKCHWISSTSSLRTGCRGSRNWWKDITVLEMSTFMTWRT